MDEQVLATTNIRSYVPAGSSVVDHCKVVEALYEAFIGVFHTNWHASVLVCDLFDMAQDRFTRDVALYLY